MVFSSRCSLLSFHGGVFFFFYQITKPTPWQLITDQLLMKAMRSGWKLLEVDCVWRGCCCCCSGDVTVQPVSVGLTQNTPAVKPTAQTRSQVNNDGRPRSSSHLHLQRIRLQTLTHAAWRFNHLKDVTWNIHILFCWPGVSLLNKTKTLLVICFNLWP